MFSIIYLGITDFDLLADYGKIEWLGNFTIVALYNAVFATAATLCLFNKFTTAVRKELISRYINFKITSIKIFKIIISIL